MSNQPNPAQQAAIEHRDGPALVVAGAGTGKTRVITERIAHLIASQVARPTEILALTFTEKAAREMAERLYDLVGWQSYQVPVLTFNAFGGELIARYGHHIGRSTRGGLLNDTQKALLLQRHIDRVELSYYGPHSNIIEFLESVIEYIGKLQNAGITAESYVQFARSLRANHGDMHPQDINEQEDLAKLYELYEHIKLETGTIDYNDQLQVPLQILQQRPNVVQRLQRQYQYVLVDEYQDTNTLQDQLLRQIISPNGNLFAVGDDDQAIYGFRGADINNILQFVDHFKVQRPLALIENYRSGQEILDAAYRLITHNNPERLEAKLGLHKQLHGQRDGSAVQWQPYATQADEYDGVVEAILGRMEAGEAAGSIAVLSATHAPLRQIAKRLRARNIGFSLSTQVNIFEQPELNQLWYLLQWLGLSAEDEAVGHVIMSGFIGWTAEQYRQVVVEAREKHNDVETTLRHMPESNTAQALIRNIDAWRSWSVELPVSQLVYRLIFETGVSDELISQAVDKPRIIRVFEDLGQLMNQMQDFESVAIDPTLAGYLQSFPKPPSIEVAEPVGDEEGVQLLTVHASKGLEFDTVYLIGCSARSWIGSRSSGFEIPPELYGSSELPPEHEARRLMYVAITRAKQTLVVSAPTQTAAGARQTVSPFVSEMFGGALPDTTTVLEQHANMQKSLQKLQRFYPLQQKAKATLPFEQGNGWLELGVGDLGAYEFCPYDFYLEKVLRIQQPFGPQLAFGTAVHAVIQRFYEAKLHGTPITSEELTQVLDEQWSERGYGSAQQAEQAYKSAKHSLSTFLARDHSEENVMGVELPIKYEIPEAKLRLKGRIDAFFQRQNGIELRDFKTGRKRNQESLERDAKNSFQLRTYALAYRQMTGQAPISVTLDYVVTNTVGTAELSNRILDNHHEKLIKLATEIRARNFAPKPSNVHQCAAIRYYGTAEPDEVTVAE